MLERDLQKKIIKELKKEVPSDLFAYKTNDQFVRGLPDIIGCYRGVFVGLEIKTETGRLSEAQKLTLEKIKHAGGIGRVVRNIPQVWAVFEEIDIFLRKKGQKYATKS